MIIQDNGTPVASQPILNFTNASSISVDGAEARIDVTLPGSGGGGAPTDADYLVKTANAGLSAERVVTDTATVAWDWATAGQAKANVPNLSGTNTGDQTITLTGDVTGSGTGSFAATVANDAVTYGKIQNVSAASKLLGRGSAAGAGDVEEITLGTGLAMSATTLSASGVNLTGPITSVGAATSVASQTGTGSTFVMDSGPVFAAGTASANTWPKLTAGTLLTTAEDGAIEMDADAIYACTDAGNRGVIPVQHIIRADATRTFTSNTSQQAIFNSPASGTLTLETGCYMFEGLIAMTSMSATSGNGKFSLIGAGTATLAAILWQAYGGDVAAEGTAAAIGGSWHVIATQTAVNVVTAATGTALCFLVKGTFEVSVAGTIIPSFAQTTAAAAVVSVGSYFMCNRIGSTSLTSIGQWS